MYHAPRIDQPGFDRVAALAKSTGYNVEFRATKYVRGWPQASTRPYLLQYDDGTFIAAFATAKACEVNLRGRAGC